jgi:hypothetical protein
MMKLLELAEYCKKIEIDCDVCEHKSECDRFQSFVTDGASPYAVVEAVNNNRQF